MLTVEVCDERTIESPREAPAPPLFVVERLNRLFFLPASEVDYITSQGNYLGVHRGGEMYLRRGTLNRTAVQLAAHGFLRIHKSTIVNIARIHYAQSLGDGRFTLVMRDGSELVSSESYREQILTAGGLSLPLESRRSPAREGEAV